MITPEASADLHRGERFDLMAALLIGVVAVLAAVLAVIEIGTGQESARAQFEAARLTTDLSAGLQASSLVDQALVSQLQAAALLSIEGAGRGLAALEHDDDIGQLVGTAQMSASTALDQALAATAATVGGPPLDAYSARLVLSTIDQLSAEVTEQNHQVDLAAEANARNTRSVLGLSFLALGGVLIGLGVVLRESRAGWFSLFAAGAIVAAAATMAILAVV